MNENPDQGPYRTSSKVESLGDFGHFVLLTLLITKLLGVLANLMMRHLSRGFRFCASYVNIGAILSIAALISCVYLYIGIQEVRAERDRLAAQNGELLQGNRRLFDNGANLVVENARLRRQLYDALLISFDHATDRTGCNTSDRIVTDEYGVQCLDSELEGPEGTCPSDSDGDDFVADDYGIVCHVSEIESDGKMELCP